FCFLVEANGAAGSESNVSQMTEPSTFVPFLNVRVGTPDVPPRRVLNAINEIPLMDRAIRRFDVALIRGLDAIFDMPTLPVKNQSTALTVQGRAGTCSPRPDPMFPGDRAIGEIVARRQRIGSFLSVVVKELAASGHDPVGSVQIEEPAQAVQ